MAAVMIGVDPAKRSHAMAVLDEREKHAGGVRSATTAPATGRCGRSRGGGRNGPGRSRALAASACSWRSG